MLRIASNNKLGVCSKVIGISQKMVTLSLCDSTTGEGWCLYQLIGFLVQSGCIFHECLILSNKFVTFVIFTWGQYWTTRYKVVYCARVDITFWVDTVSQHVVLIILCKQALVLHVLQAPSFLSLTSALYLKDGFILIFISVLASENVLSVQSLLATSISNLFLCTFFTIAMIFYSGFV